MTQHKHSHRIKWHDQHIKWHDMTCHVATNHSSSPHVTSQPCTLLHLTPQATSWHQNRSHHHHGTAEGSFTAKKWLGHRAHSIGKFLLWLIVFFFETSGPRLVRALLVYYVSINALIVLNELLSRMGLFFNAKWGNGFTVGWFRVILRVDETCKTGGRVAHSCNRSWVSAVEYMVPCCSLKISQILQFFASRFRCKN